MSNVESITYEELLKECNWQSSPQEFQRTLRARKDLPQISHNKPVERRDAQKIVLALTGHTIDWLKYKTQKKDIEDEGPLSWNEGNQVIHEIEKLSQQLDLEFDTKENFRLVGLACSGGFLEGVESSTFVLNLNKGTNVIIGDRGSGKSTAINLLGLISDSVGEETQALVSRLLNLLYSDNNNLLNEVANLNRRLLKTLRHYGIVKYAIFFIRDGEMRCYYVDRPEKTYSFLRKKIDDYWRFDQDPKYFLSAPFLYLSQGEVTRIAEDQGEKYYLNNILDGIYPSLLSKRSKLIKATQDIILQHRQYSPKYQKPNLKHVKRFIEERSIEIDQMRALLKRSRFNDRNENLIYEYLERSSNYRSSQPEKFWETRSISEYLKDENEDSLYYLYVSRITGFLYKKLKTLRDARLSKRQHTDIEKVLPASNFEEVDHTSLATGETGALLEIQTNDDVGKIDVIDELVQTAELDKDRKDERFSEASANPQHQTLDHETREIVSELLEWLFNRLKVMRSWVRIYDHENRDVYTKNLASLVEKYIALLNQKNLLIAIQKETCLKIADILNKDNLAINISTIVTEQSVIDIQTEVDDLASLNGLYDTLVNSTLQTPLRDLWDTQNKYDGLIEAFREKLTQIDSQLKDGSQEQFFFPIKIELLQGNVYREFQNLSFGQKSGIILKMVLSTTNKSVIIIDQPEDNLDTYSIINIIAPSLRVLRHEKNRQIILVTHNSSLVMDINPDYLIVLESRGNNGRVKIQDSPITQKSVQEIFDILEGGLNTFSQKMKTYENYIGQTKIHRDSDINLIESSFRRKTIDGLRNYLQPIVSDKSILDFLRHQLKQWNPDVFRQEIGAFIESLEDLERDPERGQDRLFDMLTDLSKNLDLHMTKFVNSIDEIRQMDIQPKKEKINLFQLFETLRNDAIPESSRSSRKINLVLDDSLKGIFVIADKNHLILVIKNLIFNSLRATEKVAIRHIDSEEDFIETINIKVDNTQKNVVRILYFDNGSGVPKQIRSKLYIEPCSDKTGKDHGLGGIIIGKLLELNNGSITIFESVTDDINSYTTQRITLQTEENYD